MAWEYNIGGVKHRSSKELNDKELNQVVGQYKDTGVLNPKAQQQEQMSYAQNLENKGLQKAFRTVYKRENGEDFQGTSEELTDEYYEWMRFKEGNIGSLLMLTGRLKGDYYNEDERAAIGAMWHTWDKTVPFYAETDKKWSGLFDHVQAIGADPTTWAGLATGGVGLAGRTAAVEAAKFGLKSQLKHYLGGGAARAAVGEGAYSAAQSVALQETKHDLGLRDQGATLGQTAKDTAIGMGLGATLGAGMGAGMLLNDKRKLARQATEGVAETTPKAPKGNVEDADQTLDAASEFNAQMADPAVVAEKRAAARDKFLNSVSEATLENIRRNSKSGQKISHTEARDNALQRLESLGVTDWTPKEILGRLKNLPETHASFSDYAALAVDVETSIYKDFVTAHSAGTGVMDAFKLYNEAAGVAARYSGEAARALSYQKVRARLDGGEYADIIAKFAETHDVVDARMAMEALGKSKSVTGRALEIVNEVYINNILGSPVTIAVNLTSGYLHQNQKWMQKVAGGVASLSPKEFAEGWAQGVAMHTNLATTFGYMLKAANRSKGFIDPQRAMHEAVDTGDDIALGNRDFQIFGGGDNGLRKQANESIGMYGANIIGNVNRMVGKRAMVATDEWIKHSHFRTELRNLVVNDLQETHGLSFVQAQLKAGSEVKLLVQEQLNSAVNGSAPRNPKIIKALESAREVAFQNDFRSDVFGTVGKATTKLRTMNPASNFLVTQVAPFIRTPSNILSHVGQMTPGLQGFSGHVKQTLAAGGPKAKEMENMMQFGTMLWATAIATATMGMSTGSGSDKRGQRNVKMAKDQTGYSIQGTDGKSYNIRKLDPYARPLLIMGQISDVFQYGDEKEQADLMSALVLGSVKALTEMPTLTGIKQVADAFREDSFTAGTERYAYEKVGSFMPYVRFYRDVLVATGNDVHIPNMQTIDDAITGQPHLFNWSTKVNNPKRDAIFGTPIQKLPHMGYSFSGIEMASPSDDPVLKELDRLHVSVEAPTKTLGNVNMTNHRLSEDSIRTVYDRYQELVGIVKSEEGLTLHDALKGLITNPEYKMDLTDDLVVVGHRSEGQKSERIGKVISLYRQSYAKEALVKELGNDHPFTIEYFNKQRLDQATKAGFNKTEAGQFLSP